MIRLTDRDKLVLKTLNRLRVLDIESIQMLCGFGGYHGCAVRMAEIYKEGYVDYHQESVSSKRNYFITQKGMNVIFPGVETVSKSGKKYIKYKEPPTFREKQANHEIKIAKVLAWVLKCNPEVTMDDFKTDREMQPGLGKNRKIFTHCSDLECERYRVKIEVELTLKNKDRLRNNISYNGKKWVQVWVAGNQSIYNTLMTEKERFPSLTIFVVMYDELEENPIILKDMYRYLIRRHPELDIEEELVAQGQMSIDEIE